MRDSIWVKETVQHGLQYSLLAHSPAISHVFNGGAGRMPSYTINTKIMVIAVIILFSVMILVLALHLYAKLSWKGPSNIRESSSGRPESNTNSNAEFHPNISHLTILDDTSEGSYGLDKSIIENLPICLFNPGKADTVESFHLSDCAVCLEEFQSGEAILTIPKCSHKFHTDCIYMWFDSHSACPLCRCNVASNSHESSPRTSFSCSPSRCNELLYSLQYSTGWESGPPETVPTSTPTNPHQTLGWESRLLQQNTHMPSNLPEGSSRETDPSVIISGYPPSPLEPVPCVSSLEKTVDHLSTSSPTAVRSVREPDTRDVGI